MLFRKDINGLRGIAVLAVVLFHFNPSWLPGGFVGVDVFFVISGFLMTGIIFRGIENDNFSILTFYQSRAKRIIPALAILCLTLLAFGWFYISPLDYTALGKHAAGSISFISNIIYWREAGYFDAASGEKWLLHTWSLSAEWQFYILYPIVLVSLKRFLSLKLLKLMVLLGALLGFVFCVIFTYQWPQSSYFLLPSRIWEMLLGGVAYLYPLMRQDSSKKILEWGGLALIVGSYLFISKENLWPGYLAIFPVMGAFLYIQSQSGQKVATNNFIMQRLGDWSYSIYLWHWPLAVAITYYSLGELFSYLGVLLSVVLGYISYKFLEKPTFISLQSINHKPVYLALITLMISCFVLFNKGFESHYPLSVVQADKESLNRNPHGCIDGRTDFGPCYIGNKKNVKAIIVGDSHADALTTSLASTIDVKSEGIIAMTISSCPLILDAKLVKYNDYCDTANKKRMSFLENNYDNVPVFWVARTTIYVHGISTIDKGNSKPLVYFTNQYDSPTEPFLSEFAGQLEKTILEIKKNHPVYMVQPTPEMGENVPKRLSRSLLLKLNDTDFSIAYDAYQDDSILVRKLLGTVAKTSNVALLDPIPFLCNTSRCVAQKEGRPIYYDDNHLSEYGNKLLTPMFKRIMDNYSINTRLSVDSLVNPG